MKPLTLLFAVVATRGLLIAQAALAGTRLHSNIMVEGDLVTLGDLFTETGALAGEPLLEAPAPGERTVLRSDEIARLASAYGLDWHAEPGSKVVIERASQIISAGEIADRLADEIFIITGGNEVEIELTDRRAELHVGLYESADFAIRHLSYDERSNRFSAVLVPPSGDLTGVQLKVAGRAFKIIEIPVLNRRLRTDDIVAEGDIYWVVARVDALSGDIVLDPADVIGMAARRGIRADQPIRLRDLEAPKLVVKGAPVTMVYRTGAMVLTVIGKAIDSGAAGSTVRVLNPQSNLVIQAVVTGRDVVTVPSVTAFGTF